MESLKQQVQIEIKNVPSCNLQDIKNMLNLPLQSKREGQLCLFKYLIPCGFLKRKKIIIGIELPPNDYPRLPPHFIHLKEKEFNEEIINKIGRIHEKYIIEEETWIVLSRPPQDIWDDLDSPKKNLYTFFESHLKRFWENL